MSLSRAVTIGSIALLVGTGTVRITTAPVFAQSQGVMMAEEDLVEATDSTMMNKDTVEYSLPYPGILPDHPLYFLKRLRDTIIERLVVDPERKVMFYVLQSDKQLNSALFLREKSKHELARDAVVRSAEYMQRATDAMSQMKSSGKPAPASVIEQITKSMEKHEQILVGLIEGGEGYQGSDVEHALNQLRDQRQSIESSR